MRYSIIFNIFYEKHPIVKKKYQMTTIKRPRRVESCVNHSWIIRVETPDNYQYEGQNEW